MICELLLSPASQLSILFDDLSRVIFIHNVPSFYVLIGMYFSLHYSTKYIRMRMFTPLPCRNMLEQAVVYVPRCFAALCLQTHREWQSSTASQFLNQKRKKYVALRLERTT